MSSTKESAEAVFERITRRRNQLDTGIEAALGDASRPAPDVADPAPSSPVWTAPAAVGIPAGPAGGGPLRVDEVLSQAHVEPLRETFPRSATMRFILNNPTLALGVGLPAAALLLKSHATRRALRLVIEAGTRPGVQNLLGLSAATVRLMQAQKAEKAQEAQPVASPSEDQKKAP